MKLVLSMIAALSVFSVLASGLPFPYGTDVSVRHEACRITASSFETEVGIPSVEGGMPYSDSVATVYAAIAEFCASDEENWREGTNSVGDVQASLAMKYDNGICKWMGYTAGEWKEFSAADAVAENGEWDVKVDVDYTVSPARIRYSVRKPGAADYVTLLNEGDDWVPVGTTDGGCKLDEIALCGYGDAYSVFSMSGARAASFGSLEVANRLTLESMNLVVSVRATDTWGVDAAKVLINGQERTAAFVEGEALVDVSDCIEMGGDYTYDVSLIGICRGKDLTVSGGSKDVYVGNTDMWFAYEGGVFTNAMADANLTNEGGVLSADPVSPRGRIIPAEALPCRPDTIELVSTLDVAGAVQESALDGLDTDGSKSALTVVRFGDGTRAWAVLAADGWKKLAGKGVSAANGTYTVRMSFSCEDGAKTVAYAVRNASGEFIVLEDENGNTAFAAGDSLVAEASILGGAVSSLAVTCKSTPKAEKDPAIDPSRGETEIVIKAADAMSAGEAAIAAIVVPVAAGSTLGEQAAYRDCFKVVSSKELVGRDGCYLVTLALDEMMVDADAVAKDLALSLDKISEVFGAGGESCVLPFVSKNLKAGLWYSVVASGSVGFETETVESERVCAIGDGIELEVRKPRNVGNSCFLRVMVNAAKTAENRTHD